MNTNTPFRPPPHGRVCGRGLVLPAFAACGADLDPPAQNINRGTGDKDTKAPAPEHTSGNRNDFGDEYGKRATTKPRRPVRTKERSLNRMNFRDNGL